jgi:drug/metabolite transporter (DMT)-like permease
MIRARFAAGAATCAVAAVLLSLVGAWGEHAAGSSSGDPFDDSVVIVLVVAAVVLAVPAVLLGAYALDRLPTRAAVTAIVLLAVSGLFVGGATLYLPYLGAILGGLAVAAGDRLAPPAPDDDRFTRPMPRRDESSF